MDALDSFYAGFFDADGSIMLTGNGAQASPILLVTITQVEREVLDAFEERYDGHVQGPFANGRNTQYRMARPVYRWSAQSQRAEEFLRKVSPYLIVKRDRAKLALSFRDLFKGSHNFRGPISEERRARYDATLALRHEAAEQMRGLNQRGLAASQQPN